MSESKSEAPALEVPAKIRDELLTLLVPGPGYDPTVPNVIMGRDTPVVDDKPVKISPDILKAAKDGATVITGKGTIKKILNTAVQQYLLLRTDRNPSGDIMPSQLEHDLFHLSRAMTKADSITASAQEHNRDVAEAALVRMGAEVVVKLAQEPEFDEMRARALKEKISFAELVRRDVKEAESIRRG